MKWHQKVGQFFRYLFSSGEENRDSKIPFVWHSINGVVVSGYMIIQIDYSEKSVAKRLKVLDHKKQNDWIQDRLQAGFTINRNNITICLRRQKLANIAITLGRFLEPELAQIDIKLIDIQING